jgi:RNA polymerase sigma factor (sigma-70 family)
MRADEPPYNIRSPTSSSVKKIDMTASERDELAVVMTREQSRLRNFIRRRVADPRDAEDILQDVFAELVEANQLLMPIGHVSGWLFRVARNRIIDLFRKKKADSLEIDELLPLRTVHDDLTK